MAHILLSGTYKSNNFSSAFIVCTFHAQLVCKNGKKSVLSTDKLAFSQGGGQTEKLRKRQKVQCSSENSVKSEEQDGCQEVKRKGKVTETGKERR
ncbi:hypothetical protein HV337_05230 [Citrobacter freundii]|uniref:hypothetical protein n=1 Tax=Citrobacter freundii TaxID=546 RepID=UPI0015E9D1AE|nr:hypothetical protein [Citrobacter freundii]QLR71988.1 hypothetical protein HV337_05230 [Citrobacter freundii]QLY51187.1 hypothetical protein HV186_05185 [Citrobacter freundii]